MKSVECPACRQSSEHLTAWSYSGLDDSVFNYQAEFYGCAHCGLVYIANITDGLLEDFYRSECNYATSDHFDSRSPENIRKYSAYKNILRQALSVLDEIVDVGCGRGGFLTWLKASDPAIGATGVDLDERSIADLARDGGAQFLHGGALSLPFEDKTQSVLTYFHVLEHIQNIDGVLQEAARVLRDDALILIEVPDAERYENQPIGGAFWFSIREHIYHFTESALCRALERNQFTIHRVLREVLPTPDFRYPSLMILARKKPPIRRFADARISSAARYLAISKKKLERQANAIDEAAKQGQPVTFWGCSSELYSLLPLIKSKEYRIVDSDHGKQGCSVMGTKILHPEQVEPKGQLVIASYLHSKAIRRSAESLGWSRESHLLLS